MFNRKLITITGLAILVIAALLLMERCKPSDDKELVAILPSANAYMGEQACKTCHASAYNEWMQSHHYKAMLPANDSTVLGNFNNAVYTADGVTSRFFRKDGKFYINTQGEDGKNHDYEVKYTFGFTPLQQYLVEFPGGRMQATRQCWDVKARKWFHQYAGQKLHHADWLHWTGNAQNWNTMCANCHSTSLKKNYTIDTDSYATDWDIINVSCESCHGPGKSHIDFVNSQEYKKGDSLQGSRILVARKSEHLMQVNACAYCHARRSEISNDFIAGREVMDYIIPEIPSVQYFHADGQVNEEDYIYTSFLQSKMFRHGVQCGHCHNPHSGKKLFEGNALCTQCHVKKYDDPAHTFHPTGSKSPDCVSCHMPGKYFMGNDYRHDHSFRIPRPDLSLKYATPNACNNCHTNKNAQWAAAAIEKWYGPKRTYHFAEDLVPGSRMDQNSEAHLLKLLADTSIPAIVKAAAAHYLENHPTNASQAALIKCLSDTNAQLRYRALRSLSVFPSSGWLMQVGERLSDPVKAVRIAAADLFLTIPAQQVPTQFAQPLALARSELDGYLRYQADFAVGNLQIADHYLRQQDYLNAEKFYQRALKKDSLLNYARLNLSSVYNAQGKNQQALQALLQAVKIDPTSDRIYYNLALLYAELKNEPEAKANFEKAVQLKSENPRLYYNYGLLLMQQNDANRAEAVFLKGLSFSRDDAGLHYALAFLYLRQRQPEKALPHARFLKQIDPSNPEYAEIFRTLKL